MLIPYLNSTDFSERFNATIPSWGKACAAQDAISGV